MCEENKYIRFDWAIRNVLRQSQNFVVIEGLISILIGRHIKILEIIEHEDFENRYTDQFNRLNIKGINDKGNIIVVEILITREIHFMQRILYGVNKNISVENSLKNYYCKEHEVYSVNILYCNRGIGDDYLYYGKENFIGMNLHDSFKISKNERIGLIDIFPDTISPEYYIIRVNNYKKFPDTPLDEWVNFLKTGRIKDNTTVSGLKEAKNILIYNNLNKDEKWEYDRYIDSIMVQNDAFETARLEGLSEGLSEGRAEGRAEGAKSKALEIAGNLLKLGLSIEDVAKASELSIEEVSHLLG